MSKDSSVKSASACLVALFSLVTFAGEATPNPEDILLNGLRIAKDMVDKAQTGELPIKPGDIPIPGMKSGAPVEKSKTSDAPAAAAPIKEAPKTKATASVTTTTSSTTFTLPDCDIWLYPSGNALFFRDTEKTPTKPGSPYFMLREESDSWKLASSKGSKKVYSLAKQSPDACILLKASFGVVQSCNLDVGALMTVDDETGVITVKGAISKPIQTTIECVIKAN